VGISFLFSLAAMARTALVAAAALGGAAATAAPSAPPPSFPLFGPVMTAPFNQTIRINGLYEWDDYVDFYYDSTTTPVGSSLSVHSRGQHDELCTAVSGKGLSDEPCSLLDAADGWLYLVFPASNQCCRACNTTQFCGIISPTWLQSNATYEGVRMLGGVAADLYLKVGGEDNYYAVSVVSRGSPLARQPVNYFEGYPTFADGLNAWNFTLSAYSTAPIPSSTFAVPAGMGCETDCVLTTDSYAERLRARAAAGLRGLRRVA